MVLQVELDPSHAVLASLLQQQQQIQVLRQGQGANSEAFAASAQLVGQLLMIARLQQAGA